MAQTEKKKENEEGLQEGLSTSAEEISATEPGPAYEEIAQRAYEIYLARGSEDGHDLEDWTRAENELRAVEPIDEDI